MEIPFLLSRFLQSPKDRESLNLMNAAEMGAKYAFSTFIIKKSKNMKRNY